MGSSTEIRNFHHFLIASTIWNANIASIAEEIFTVFCFISVWYLTRLSEVMINTLKCTGLTDTVASRKFIEFHFIL